MKITEHITKRFHFIIGFYTLTEKKGRQVVKRRDRFVLYFTIYTATIAATPATTFISECV